MVNHLNPFVSTFKIGSGDVAWNDMLRKVASKKKPVFFATGAADLEEVKNAYKIINRLNKKICIMQCNTNYTGSLDNFNYINLNVLKKYKKLFPNAIIGLSDHTPGHETVLGAIALGIKVVEKHFTDDNKRIGPDHSFSMTSSTWREMVERKCVNKHTTRLWTRRPVVTGLLRAQPLVAHAPLTKCS